MNDGAAATPESGDQHDPPAVPPQTAAAPAASFPAHVVQPQSGYGFPQQDGYGFPPQSGYGYPPVQGGYGYPPPAGVVEPDWQELAAQNEASGRRRKRLLFIGGGVLAAAAVAGIVTTTLLMGGGGTPAADPTASASVSTSPSPSASVPVPTTPLGVISSSKTDKAPVSAETLFPSPTLTIEGRQYTRVVTERDKDCKSSLADGLDAALKPLSCTDVYRATYVNGTGLEITVGIATFASSSRAGKAKAGDKGHVAPLVKDKVTPFCQNVTCTTARNSLGRYAYFTIAGPADGKAVSAKDKAAPEAVKDIASSVYDTLLERGRTGLANVGG